MANDDERFMRRALRLARRGQGYVEPNPMVGCVLVQEGQIVAEGWHRRFGGPHAEIEALEQARQRGVDVRRCQLYVTLEPCAHHGKTPPCTEALVAARPARIVAAMIDPYPQVAGQGIARLQQAGLEVSVGCLEAEARQLNEPYLKRLASGLPWVIAKWAQSLDGRIATRQGQSQWISGPRSRRWAHRLRARVDAIVAGIGTVLADDPLLTARGVRLRRRALRVVVDPHLRLPVECKLVQSLEQSGSSAPAGVLVVVLSEVLKNQSDKAALLQKKGVEFFALEESGRLETSRPDRPALKPLLRYLSERYQATNVLVEGGSRLLGAFFAQRLVDQVLVFLAPCLFGDPQALGAVSGLEPLEPTAALALELRGIQRLGEDLLLDYRVPPGPVSPSGKS